MLVEVVEPQLASSDFSLEQIQQPIGHPDSKVERFLTLKPSMLECH